MNQAPRSGAAFYRGLGKVSQLSRPRFAALGSFDGLHIGHRSLLNAVAGLVHARRTGAAELISFYPHPAIVLGHAATRPPLLTLRQRLEILGKLGFEALVMVRFTNQLSQLSASQFVSDILVRQLDVDTLVVGPDAALGRGREAGIEQLEELLKQHGRSLLVVPPLEEQGLKIGSRSIRHQISEGDLSDISRLLAGDWRIEGRVVRGDGRGKSISIPTANIATRQLLPAPGVYCGLALIDQVSHPAVVNIGNRPTFSGQRITVEAHLYNRSGEDFYGQRLALEIHQKLRDEQRFESVDALVTQIRADIERARELLSARNLGIVL